MGVQGTEARVVKTLRLFQFEADLLAQLARLEDRSESAFLRFLIKRAAKDRGLTAGKTA